MKCLLVGVLIISSFLGGCGTWRSSSGMQASQSDEFDCDQKCGMYNHQIGAVEAGVCVSNCMHSKGFSKKFMD